MEKGKRVRWTAKFLQSSGMYLASHGAFDEGIIVEEKHPNIDSWVCVKWDGREEPNWVNRLNLIEVGKPDYTGI